MVKFLKSNTALAAAIADAHNSKLNKGDNAVEKKLPITDAPFDITPPTPEEQAQAKRAAAQPPRPLQMDSDVAFDALMKTWEPYWHLVASNPFNPNPEVNDAGHDHPVYKDKTSGFIIGRICQALHEALSVSRAGADGTTYDSAHAKFKKAEIQRKNVIASFWDGNRSNEENVLFLQNNDNFVKADYWMKRHEAFCSALSEQLDTFQSLYYYATGEQWRAWSPTAQAQTNAKPKISDEEMARINQQMAIAQVRGLASR